MAALNFPNAPVVGDTWPNPPQTGVPTYQWDGAQWLSKFALGKEYVPLDGSAAMTGLLTLFGDPVNALQAVPKQYVDGSTPGAPTVRYVPQTLTSAQRSQARSNIDVLKRNYITNGAMHVSQENGLTAGSASGYYPVDQFGVFTAGTTGVYSAAQIAALSTAGSTTRLRVTVTTADAAVAPGDIVWIATKLEGARVTDLLLGQPNAKTMTLQFGVKAPQGTYSVVFMNAAGNRSYAADYVIAAGENNVDTVKSITVPGDVTGAWMRDNTIGLEIRFALMAGTTWTQAPGAWGTGNIVGSTNQSNFMSSTSNVFDLFDVSLTEGTVAPPFQVPDYPSELDRCRRYWRTNPELLGHWQENSATQAQFFVAHSPPMRAAPTIAVIATTNRIARRGVATYNVGVLTGAGNTPIGSLIDINTATAAANVPANLIADTLSFNARL